MNVEGLLEIVPGKTENTGHSQYRPGKQSQSLTSRVLVRYMVMVIMMIMVMTTTTKIRTLEVREF